MGSAQNKRKALFLKGYFILQDIKNAINANCEPIENFSDKININYLILQGLHVAM